MFKRKLPQEIETVEDRTRIRLHKEVSDLSIRIREEVRRVVVKEGAANLYPEGADKDAAKKEAERAKYSLICAVGAFDVAIAEYRKFCQDNLEKFITTSNYSSLVNWNSHQIIESEYESFRHRE